MSQFVRFKFVNVAFFPEPRMSEIFAIPASLSLLDFRCSVTHDLHVLKNSAIHEPAAADRSLALSFRTATVLALASSWSKYAQPSLPIWLPLKLRNYRYKLWESARAMYSAPFWLMRFLLLPASLPDERFRSIRETLFWIAHAIK